MNERLTSELLSRVNHDQAMRRGEFEWDDSVDVENTEYLRDVVQNLGWPGLSSGGHEVAQAAWLLVQHADHDPSFQAHCLELMKSMPTGEVVLSHIAFLEDRVRVNSKQPQLYGTQFYKDGDHFGPRPIEDIMELDERRSKMGMETFAEYEVLIRQLHE